MEALIVIGIFLGVFIVFGSITVLVIHFITKDDTKDILKRWYLKNEYT